MPKPQWTKKALAALAAGGSGMVPRNYGHWLEAALVDTHRAYAVAGVAKIEKVEPPVKVVHGPPKRIIMLENPFVDFVGAWTARGGQMIHAEAKSSSEDKLPIGGEKKTASGLKMAQIEAMEAWQHAGALVCLLWGFNSEVRYVSLALVKTRLANGHKSILWAHADRVPSGQGFIMHDWLKNLGAEFGLSQAP